MSARHVVSLALAVAGTWAVAAPAAALEPGVFADPGSPAGKEYTSPLSTLRGDASGHPAVENQPQPLFGSGITPARASGGASGTRSQGRRGRSGRGRSRAAGAHRPAAGARRALSRARRVPARLEGGSAVPVGLLTAAVVLGGLALGAVVVAVRRRLE